MVSPSRRRACLCPLFLFILSAGCAHPTANADEETPPAPVKAVPAEQASFGGWTELLGATQPLPGHAARVSAAVEGHVLSVLGSDQGKPVAEGQHVDRGQVLVRLDARVIQAQRDKLLAGLEELALQKKEAGMAVKLARLDVERLDRLSSAGSGGSGIPLVSRIERDKALLALEDAETKQQGPAVKERGLRAELQALDTQLGFYQLRAPIAGRLGTVQAMPGQTLPVGATVAEVIDLTEIDVLCLAPPAVAARLQPGQPAHVRAGAAPAGQSGPPGKVVYVSVQAQAETGNYPVKVRFANPDFRLRANAVLRVEVLTDPERQRLSVRDAALHEDQDPPAVIVVENVIARPNAEGHEERTGKARRLLAQTGVRDRARGLVEIAALEDPRTKARVDPTGLLFVVEGGHGLHDGDTVKLEAAEDKDPKDG